MIMIYYPLLFSPNLHSVVWGGHQLRPYKGLAPSEDPIGESWEVSAVPSSTSIIANGPLAGRDLISVVTECVIAAVILMSFLPFVPDSPNILKFDSFIMHIVIPILTIISFLIAEPPEEKIKPIMRMNGSALITIYAVVIISLILVGVIPQNKIPYSFLEVNTRPLWYVLLAGAIVYAGSYFLSWGFIEWNRRISDNWYK